MVATRGEAETGGSRRLVWVALVAAVVVATATLTQIALRRADAEQRLEELSRRLEETQTSLLEAERRAGGLDRARIAAQLAPPLAAQLAPPLAPPLTPLPMVLVPDGRGAGPSSAGAPSLGDDSPLYVVLELDPAARISPFRLALRGPEGEIVWRGTAAGSPHGDHLSLLLRGSSLVAGEYRLELESLDPSARAPLASYSFRVE